MEKASLNLIFSLVLLFSLSVLQFSEALVGSKDLIIGPPLPCKSSANCRFCEIGFPICQHGLCKCGHLHRPADCKNGDSDCILEILICPPECKVHDCQGKAGGVGGKCCDCKH